AVALRRRRGLSRRGRIRGRPDRYRVGTPLRGAGGRGHAPPAGERRGQDRARYPRGPARGCGAPRHQRHRRVAPRRSRGRTQRHPVSRFRPGSVGAARQVPPPGARAAPARRLRRRRAQGAKRDSVGGGSAGGILRSPAAGRARNAGREGQFMTRPLTILTWHVHGSYLWYLSHIPHLVCLPVKPGRPAGYGGALPGFPWPGKVREIPADQVRRLQFDCVIYQSRTNWQEDRFEILSPAQRRPPRIFLEHDPPRSSPTDTRHFVDDAGTLLVHVTPFNDLMWDSGRTPTRVIEHGVVLPAHVRYTGEIQRGIVVINGLKDRGRRLGADIFERVRERVPLDLVGMGSEELGGLGEIGHAELPAFMARYRFLFNPVRCTSLNLAVCEAMHAGVPVVGLATTEM